MNIVQGKIHKYFKKATEYFGMYSQIKLYYNLLLL